MIVKEIFADRFALLRQVHNFSYRELGMVLGLNASSVTEWTVSRRNAPNYEKLVLISNLYGVSLDWLLGRIDSLYSHSVLASIEDNQTVNILRCLYQVPVEYEDTERRKYSYSYGVRANIITLSCFSLYSAISKVLGNQFYKIDNYPKLIESNHEKIVSAQADLLSGQGNLLHRMLSMDKKEPVYDVEYAFRQLQMK